MTDHFSAALVAYKESERNRWQFAEEASYVHGENTRALADAINRSPSTVENHRNGFKLYYQLCTHFETPEAYRLRDQVYISVMWTAARMMRKHNLSLERVYEHLQFAVENNQSVDVFSAHVDGIENTIPAWVRDLQRGQRAFDKVLVDYKSEIPPRVQKVLHRAIKVFQKIIATIPELQKESEE